MHNIFIRDESERGIREIFEKCIEYIGKILIHFREVLNFCLKSGTFEENFYQFYGSFPGVSLMMREVSHVCILLIKYFTMFDISRMYF